MRVPLYGIRMPIEFYFGLCGATMVEDGWIRLQIKNSRALPSLGEAKLSRGRRERQAGC